MALRPAWLKLLPMSPTQQPGPSSPQASFYCRWAVPGHGVQRIDGQIQPSRLHTALQYAWLKLPPMSPAQQPGLLPMLTPKSTTLTRLVPCSYRSARHTHRAPDMSTVLSGWFTGHGPQSIHN